MGQPTSAESGGGGPILVCILEFGEECRFLEINRSVINWWFQYFTYKFPNNKSWDVGEYRHKHFRHEESMVYARVYVEGLHWMHIHITALLCTNKMYEIADTSEILAISTMISKFKFRFHIINPEKSENTDMYVHVNHLLWAHTFRTWGKYGVYQRFALNAHS